MGDQIDSKNSGRNNLSRSTRRMGSGGNFNWSAAAGGQAPSAIAAMNESYARSAVHNQNVEANEHREWRQNNQEVVYAGLKDVDPESPEFDSIMSRLDSRAYSLPGVKNSIDLLNKRNASWRGQQAAQAAATEAEWDGVLGDAKEFGSNSERVEITKMRKEGLTVGDVQAWALKKGGFLERADRARHLERTGKERESTLKGAQDRYDRDKKHLERKNRSWLPQYRAIESRLAQVRAKQSEGNINAKIDSQVKIKGLENELESIKETHKDKFDIYNKQMDEYDDRLYKANTAYDPAPITTPESPAPPKKEDDDKKSITNIVKPRNS